MHAKRWEPPTQCHLPEVLKLRTQLTNMFKGPQQTATPPPPQKKNVSVPTPNQKKKILNKKKKIKKKKKKKGKTFYRKKCQIVKIKKGPKIKTN